MSLTLQIINVEGLDNGHPVRLVLDRHGAVIGRSPHADWSLPDPKTYISSTHCEIDYREGGYVLTDKSTNGTFVNGSATPLSGPHVLAEGDEVAIGHYQIRVVAGGAPRVVPKAATDSKGWAGWTDSAPAAAFSAAPIPAPPPASSGWDPSPGSAMTGRGAMAQNWAPPRTDSMTPAAAPPASAWGGAAPAGSAESVWGIATPAVSAAPSPAPASPATADIWGQFAASNSVDWARGFGDPSPPPSAAPAPSAAPFANSPAAPAWGAPAQAGNDAGWGAPAEAPPIANLAPVQPGAQAIAAGAPAGVAASAQWQAFLTAAGLGPEDLKGGDVEAARTAGDIVKRLVAGLVVMLEARARAKAQLGAQSTSLELDGNNPLKFARSPQRVVAQLLNPAERGFMGADRAVEDAFHDLQAHQMATLAAMQGALRSTLERFSPRAISERAETRGLLAKILPGARDAALWAAYEREFDGVAKGSDEAFLDVFAKEFRKAYEVAAAQMKTAPKP